MGQSCSWMNCTQSLTTVTDDKPIDVAVNDLIQSCWLWLFGTSLSVCPLETRDDHASCFGKHECSDGRALNISSFFLFFQVVTTLNVSLYSFFWAAGVKTFLLIPLPWEGGIAIGSNSTYSEMIIWPSIHLVFFVFLWSGFYQCWSRPKN